MYKRILQDAVRYKSSTKHLKNLSFKYGKVSQSFLKFQKNVGAENKTRILVQLNNFVKCVFVGWGTNDKFTLIQGMEHTKFIYRLYSFELLPHSANLSTVL
jgi:hypothetical protein